MTKRQRRQFSKFEKLIYTFTFFVVLSFPIALLFSQSQLTKVNYQVEKTKQQITTQAKSNESLEMKINELASLDKLENVAKQMGLSYNNNSIKTIE